MMFDVCQSRVVGLCRRLVVVRPLSRQIRQGLITSLLLLGVAGISATACAQDVPSKGTTAVSSGSTTQAQPVSETPPIEDSSTAKADSKLLIPTDASTVIEIMGLWMVPYIFASILLVAFSLERLVVLRRGRVIPIKFVKPFMENLKAGKLDQATAMSLCEKNGSPVAKLFIGGLRKWGRPGIEVEQAIIDGGERQVSELRRHVRAMNTISVIMPMVGLFGTVVGMVQSFNELAVAAQTGSNAMLAAGIAVALLTTAFGLAVAIPALTMYVYLMSRVESLVLTMDELANELAYYVSAEGLHARSDSSSRVKANAVRSSIEKALPVESPV